MEASLGWLIIAAFLWLPSMALLWPAYARIRRRFPDARRASLAYLTASAACALALWFLIPPLVRALFGHHGH